MSTATTQGQSARPRAPSASGYMLVAAATSATLFFTLWWMLHSGGDDSPWVPAGLAACVVLLVAVAAREVVMRRAWTRYILENDRRGQRKGQTSTRESKNSNPRLGTLDTYSAALRALQRQCAEADAPGALPESHLEAYLSCQDYLESTDEKLRSTSVVKETRAALRSGQERVRTLARHHLLSWARGASRGLTHEAQQRVRTSDKIETAQRALDVIASAIKLYPEEAELRESQEAVHEFIATVKVSHWVELAERAAFKGYYERAIDRYRDALFYLSRESMREETRAFTAERIGREIEMLRARLEMRKVAMDVEPKKNQKRSRRKSGE